MPQRPLSLSGQRHLPFGQFDGQLQLGLLASEGFFFGSFQLSLVFPFVGDPTAAEGAAEDHQGEQRAEHGNSLAAGVAVPH